jgi:hypothetical protein
VQGTGYVNDVVVVYGSKEIVRHRRNYESKALILDPLDYLALLERKTGVFEQAEPLAE